MTFPWSEIWNQPHLIAIIITRLQHLTIHDQRKKEILLDWCKEVDYPYNHDLFRWLWGEITEQQFRELHPEAP